MPKSWILRIPLLLLHSFLGLLAAVAVLSGEAGIGGVLLLMSLAIHCTLMVFRKVITSMTTETKPLSSAENSAGTTVLHRVRTHRKMLRNFSFGVTAFGLVYILLLGMPDSMGFFGMLWLSIVTGLFLQFSPMFASQVSSSSTAGPGNEWVTHFLNRLPKRKLVGMAGVMCGIWLLFLITPKLYHEIQEFGQARDPVMRQRTKEAWQQIQSLEAALAQQGGNPGARAYAYSQLDLQKVDPKLVAHVVAVVNHSREYHHLQEAISNEVSAESRGRTEAAQAVQLFGGLLGLMASGETRSLSEVERNLSAGLASGEFVGNVMSGLHEYSMRGDLKKKYGQRIELMERGLKEQASQRQGLATEFSKKYKEPFISAF